MVGIFYFLLGWPIFRCELLVSGSVDSQMIHGKCVNGIFTDFFFKEKNVDENLLSTIHTIRFVWNFGKRQLSTT